VPQICKLKMNFRDSFLVMKATEKAMKLLQLKRDLTLEERETITEVLQQHLNNCYQTID